jgi:hypothetical protein
VRAVLTGADVAAWSMPFAVGVKQPMEHWSIAIDRARYVGEPVAVVMAESRYFAEDALELIRVEYRQLDAMVDPEAAPEAPVLHQAVGTNLVNDRHFSYGKPAAAFAAATRTVSIKIHYPRNSCTPIECFAVVAEYLAPDEGYDVLSNIVLRQLFEQLGCQAGGAAAVPNRSLWQRIMHSLGVTKLSQLPSITSAPIVPKRRLASWPAMAKTPRSWPAGSP